MLEMPRVSHAFLVGTHLEGGGVNIFVPKGQRLYHVQFRVRDRARPKGWRQVLRSCGTESLTAAKDRAAAIFVEEAAGRKTPIPTQEAGMKAEPKPLATDPTITEVIGHHKVWMASAIPGEKRPLLSTANTYYQRLQQLCRLLKVETVGQLAVTVMGLTPTRLGVSEENFVPLLRGAAGVFRRACMEYYASQGLHFAVPLKSGPKIRINEFVTPPSAEQLEELKSAAETELKADFPREYLAFKLILNAGCRAQEAAHVRWVDVSPFGIRVTAEAGHCRALPERERYGPKNGQNRTIPVDPAILAELEQFRGPPMDFVIRLMKAPRHDGYVPKIRCQVVFRRLAKWLRVKLAEIAPDYKNPNHWLRKVFASVVTMEAGIETAGEYLGHAKGSPVTPQTYAALLKRPAIRIGMKLPEHVGHIPAPDSARPIPSGLAPSRK